MHEPATNIFALEASVGHWVRGIGVGIDVFGVLIIVLGIAWSTYRFVQRRMEESHYDAYKIRIGRSLLLGLEVNPGISCGVQEVGQESGEDDHYYQE